MSIREYIKKDEQVDINLDKILEQYTGAEVAKELGITRQAVSNTLKRAMKKVFLEFQKVDKSWDAFETAVAMSQGFSDLVMGSDEVELKKFFRLFPPDIKKRIEQDAEKRMAGRKNN